HQLRTPMNPDSDSERKQMVIPTQNRRRGWSGPSSAGATRCNQQRHKTLPFICCDETMAFSEGVKERARENLIVLSASNEAFISKVSPSGHPSHRKDGQGTHLLENFSMKCVDQLFSAKTKCGKYRGLRLTHFGIPPAKWRSARIATLQIKKAFSEKRLLMLI